MRKFALNAQIPLLHVGSGTLGIDVEIAGQAELWTAERVGRCQQRLRHRGIVGFDANAIPDQVVVKRSNLLDIIDSVAGP